MTEKILVVDIAHPPLEAPEAEERLDTTLREVILSSSLRGIKIIHGYGDNSSTSPKAVADNWIFLNKARLKCAIRFDGIDTFDHSIEELASQVRFSIKEEMGVATEGSTIVWVQ